MPNSIEHSIAASTILFCGKKALSIQRFKFGLLRFNPILELLDAISMPQKLNDLHGD